MTHQAISNAHLRQLPRCAICGKAAAKQLYSGINTPMAVYCERHAKAALSRFKEQS